MCDDGWGIPRAPEAWGRQRCHDRAKEARGGSRPRALPQGTLALYRSQHPRQGGAGQQPPSGAAAPPRQGGTGRQTPTGAATPAPRRRGAAAALGRCCTPAPRRLGAADAHGRCHARAKEARGSSRPRALLHPRAKEARGGRRPRALPRPRQGGAGRQPPPGAAAPPRQGGPGRTVALEDATARMRRWLENPRAFEMQGRQTTTGGNATCHARIPRAKKAQGCARAQKS